jgi:hypothetical protein
VEEPFYERGMEIKTRQEYDQEDRDLEADSNSTIGVLFTQEHPGKWAKAQDVYGGHDGQVEFENIEQETA